MADGRMRWASVEMCSCRTSRCAFTSGSIRCPQVTGSNSNTRCWLSCSLSMRQRPHVGGHELMMLYCVKWYVCAACRWLNSACDLGYRSNTRLCPHADDMLHCPTALLLSISTTPRAGAHLSHERPPGSTPGRWLTIAVQISLRCASHQDQ